MGTLEWVKPALKRAVPFSPTVTLHTSIHAELRAPLAEIQKGQNHSFTLPHSHLCIPSVHECMYCTATLKTHTHTHTNRHKTAPFWSRRVATPPPPANRHNRDQSVAGYCPDAVLISLMLTQMSMGSSDKGFLIPHMNIAPKGRGEACVCGKYEGAAWGGIHYTRLVSGLNGSVHWIQLIFKSAGRKGATRQREWWACRTIELSLIHLSPCGNVFCKRTQKSRHRAEKEREKRHTNTPIPISLNHLSGAETEELPLVP